METLLVCFKPFFLRILRTFINRNYEKTIGTSFCGFGIGTFNFLQIGKKNRTDRTIDLYSSSVAVGDNSQKSLDWKGV
jgi:hypothetical protein